MGDEIKVDKELVRLRKLEKEKEERLLEEAMRIREIERKKEEIMEELRKLYDEEKIARSRQRLGLLNKRGLSSSIFGAKEH